LLAACDGSLLSPAEERALVEAQAAWDAAGYRSYVFEYRRVCFCESAEWMRITVTDDVVSDVVYADSADVAHPAPEQWPTVDELLARLQTLRSEGGDLVAELDVTFDPLLGYPTFYSIEMTRNVADGDSTHWIRSLAPTP
jgi:hypothetical protein